MAERQRHRRGPGESGAALVEAALVLVVVVALITGVSVAGAEWGGGTRVGQLATWAVRLAARSSDPPTSDLEVLALVGAGLGSASLERLVVYRPTGADGSIPSGCADLWPTGTDPVGVTGSCNAFGPGHLAALAGAPAGARGCDPGSWEVSWCPAARRRGPGSPEWVGVLLEVRTPAASADTTIAHRARAVAALDPPPPGRP